MGVAICFLVVMMVKLALILDAVENTHFLVYTGNGHENRLLRTH